jgi:hypothetical protein
MFGKGFGRGSPRDEVCSFWATAGYGGAIEGSRRHHPSFDRDEFKWFWDEKNPVHAPIFCINEVYRDNTVFTVYAAHATVKLDINNKIPVSWGGKDDSFPYLMVTVVSSESDVRGRTCSRIRVTDLQKRIKSSCRLVNYGYPVLKLQCRLEV